MDENQIASWILNGQITTVDSNLKTKIPDDIKRTKKEVEDDLDAYATNKENGDLVLGKQTLQDLNLRLMALIEKTSAHINDSKNKNSNKVSLEQHRFKLEIKKLVLRFSSFCRIFRDKPILDEVVKTLTVLTTLQEYSKENLSQLIKNTIGGQETDTSFMKKVTRKFERTMDDIYGITQEKQLIIEMLENTVFSNKYAFIMLYGPPGTGKSSLAQAMASIHSDSVMLVLNMTELLSPTFGVTEQGIRAVFEYAEKHTEKNITILLDEIDLIFSKDQTSEAIRTVRTAIQTEIEGARLLKSNVCIIGITNYYANLTDALKRRATANFLIQMPETTELLDMLPKIVFATGKDEPKIINVTLSSTFIDGMKQLIETIRAKKQRMSIANLKNWLEIATNAYLGQLRNQNFQIVSLNNGLQIIIKNQNIESGTIQIYQTNIKLLKEAKKPTPNMKIFICPPIKYFTDTEDNVEFMTEDQCQQYSLKTTEEYTELMNARTMQSQQQPQ